MTKAAQKPILTVCLYTTTQGHWKIKTRFKTTVSSLQKQVKRKRVTYLASIKKSPGDDAVCEEMKAWLEKRGFEVSVEEGAFSHHQDSHQIGYLNDMARLTLLAKTPYVLHLEDDWVLGCEKGSVWEKIEMAIDILEEHQQAIQVRIPRYSNEPDRINNLPVKHGIQTRAMRLNESFWTTSDWSNNPFIARTRDLRAALIIVNMSDIPKHAEHGLKEAMVILSCFEFPMVIFDPSVIRCAHIGTKKGDEDDIKKPLFIDLVPPPQPTTPPLCP